MLTARCGLRIVYQCLQQPCASAGNAKARRREAAFRNGVHNVQTAPDAAPNSAPSACPIQGRQAIEHFKNIVKRALSQFEFDGPSASFASVHRGLKTTRTNVPEPTRARCDHCKDTKTCSSCNGEWHGTASTVGLCAWSAMAEASAFIAASRRRRTKIIQRAAYSR